jgi:raffinose/stachyose/melibiose transport system permease protein
MKNKSSQHLIFWDKFGMFSRYGVMIVFAFLSMIPFLWLLISSFKSNDEIYGKPFALPSVFQFENYITAWNKAHIGQNLTNSLTISVTAVIIMLLFASMAAYVLTRVTPNLFFYTYFTLGIMIPVHTVLIPTFILMKNFGLYNTMYGLIILYAASNLSLAVFILTGFMKSIPREIEEAAILDGCSLTRIFFSIILPLSTPGLATVGILTFLNCWNEYLFAYVLISNPNIKTITQGIYALQGAYNTNYGPLTAALVIAILPVLIVYVIFQEQVIAGMTAGAVKG